MQKPAVTQYPVHELIRQRWSPLAFAERTIEPEKVGSLLEAARWAPSSYNQQPWSYILATRDDTEEFQRLFSCLVEGNQPWASRAGLLLLAVAKLHFDHTGKPNRHAFHDVGLANENLVLQAVALGLAAHQMAGFDRTRARQLYEIPDTHEPLTMIAVGYPGRIDDLPESYRDRESAPRTRKPLAEMAFRGRWGEPSPIVAAK